MTLVIELGSQVRWDGCSAGLIYDIAIRVKRDVCMQAVSNPDVCWGVVHLRRRTWGTRLEISPASHDGNGKGGMRWNLSIFWEPRHDGTLQKRNSEWQAEACS
jgi:hypothetical protein